MPPVKCGGVLRKKVQKMITQEELKALFVYEPDTGMLRRIDPVRKAYPWRKIGRNGRHLATTIKGETCYLHRLVWLYHKGEHPIDMIDHINRDTSDNRIENLRECDNAHNQYNARRKANNVSGRKGVVRHNNCPGRPWQAKIVVRGKTISLGYFANLDDAANAYAEASKKYAKEFAYKGQ